MAVSALFRRVVSSSQHLSLSGSSVDQLLGDLGDDYVFDGKVELGGTTLIAISSVDHDYRHLEQRLDRLIEEGEAGQAMGRNWYRPFAIYADGDSAGVVIEQQAIRTAHWLMTSPAGA